MNRKPSRKVAEEIRRFIKRHARVQRPSLVEFMLNDYWAMTKLPQTVIDSPIVRADDHFHEGWTIPVDSLGRKGAEVLTSEISARSASESIRIWIGKFLGTVVSPANLAIVVEADPNDESVILIRLYRKA